jgi:hypothetical protein
VSVQLPILLALQLPCLAYQAQVQLAALFLLVLLACLAYQAQAQLEL